MLQALSARFMPRFIQTARARLASTVAALAEAGGAAVAVSELHTLAGEAAVLGLAEVGEVARAGEAAARRWQAGGPAGAQIECARIVRTLRQKVDALAAAAVGPDGPGVAAPAARSAPGGRAGPPPVAVGPPGRDAAPLRVLVIDDSAVAAEAVADGLRAEGMEVRLASSRGEALAAMADFAPGVVLCDLSLPDLDPADLIEVATPIRRPALVLLSGLPEAEVTARARAMGAAAGLCKALGMPAIARRVRALAAGASPEGEP